MALINENKPTLQVHHAELERASDESAYKSSCPACKIGLLLVARDKQMNLVREDRCIACGQPVYYLDIAIGEEILPPRKASWKVQST